MSNILVGCIADDFTGASDAASFLALGGFKTILFSGAPDDERLAATDANAVVIALKTRTCEKNKAVEASRRALRVLKKAGAKKIYIKYCSTFDSAPTGNIGPICDMALEECRCKYTVICPSMPINGRTVAGGILYVNGIPVGNTHMRYHPLTPIWDSYIPELMREQSRYPCCVIDRDTMKKGKAAVLNAASEIASKNDHFYFVPDYESDEDAKAIISAFGDIPLLTGGSGLLKPIGVEKFGNLPQETDRLPPVAGKAIIFAGSCSEATCGQVKHFLDLHTGAGIMLDPKEDEHGEKAADPWCNEIAKANGDTIMVYSPGSAGNAVSRGSFEMSAKIESIMVELAKEAVKNGYKKIITAGGETSGAIIKALKWDAYRIGKSVAPGVPVLAPLGAEGMRIVLKSGNYGQPDFFEQALKLMGADS